MAITTIHRTAARPAAFMDQAISITESSWVWAHGRTGAMAMVGVSIALTAPTVEDTSSPVETADALMPPIVDMAQFPGTPATRTPAPTPRPTPQPRMVAANTAAANITKSQYRS